MICGDCIRLILALNNVESIHAEKAKALNGSADQSDQREYCRLFNAAYSAKIDMVIARLELKRHQRSHGRIQPTSESCAAKAA